MRIIRTILHDFLYNGHLQTIGATIVTMLSFSILHVRAPYGLYICVYMLVLFVFYYDRFSHMVRDSVTNSTRSNHVRKVFHIIRYFMVFLLLGSIIGVLFLAPVSLAVLFVIVALLGYLYPHYMKDITTYIPLWKNIYVSSVYPLFVVLPVLYTETFALSLDGVFFSFIVFFDSFIAQVLLDTKDIASDRKYGLKTLGVMVGQNETLHITSTVQVCVGIGCIMLGLYLHVMPLVLWIALLSMGTKQVIIYVLSHKIYAGYFACAGIYIFYIPYEYLYRVFFGYLIQ